MPGLFITFEGTEGGGKSTQILRLAERLAALGLKVCQLREPGGTAIGEEIRHTLKHSPANHSMTPEAELLLMNASRAQLVREVIRPALLAGETVLCDRFCDSTIAYQGYGRQLDLPRVRSVIDFAVGDTRPDLTLLLRVPMAVSEARCASRGLVERDRFEEAGRDFFRRVEQGYDAIADGDPSRVKVIDATQAVEAVAGEIWRHVQPLVEALASARSAPAKSSFPFVRPVSKVRRFNSNEILTMGADTSVAQQVEAPPLQPLALKTKLAGTPAQPPKYSLKIKNASGEEVVVADPRATRALVALMDVHAVNGGAACHWGGPAAYAEMMAAIHAIMFGVNGRAWHEAYNFVNDAGHAENGIYALRANYGFDHMTFEDLKGFRSLQSKLTGHGEAHLNPEGVLLSNGPLGSALPQAQGLAIADKVAKRDRVTICVVSDGASMEGEAKEAFAAIPGLAAKDRVNPFVLLISDNDTKLSGRITKDSFSMQRTFQAMGSLGWNVLSVANGHDLQAVYQYVEKGIEQAKANPNVPVCLWVKTIKGYGVKATMDNAAGGHGFPLSNGEKIIDFVNEIYGGQTPEEFANWAKVLRADWEKKEAEKKAKSAAPASTPAVKKDKIQSGLAKAAIKAATEGLPVYSISSDVQGSTGISAFHKTFPDRCVEVGIAEANMVSTGAGFSKAGFIPIVDTFGQFGVTKGNLPLTMAALSQAPVIAMFSHVGFQDAADGASHEATTYFAATSAIPHTVVIAPSCADEAEALMHEAIKRLAAERNAGKDGETYIFFVGRENYPLSWVENAKYPWGKAQVLQQGSDVVLIGCGPLLDKAINAGKKLAEKGVKATVINNPFINRVDIETIGAAVKASSGRVVTVEDHQIVCGMGAQVSHALSQAGIAHRIKTLGIKGEFGQSAYVAEHLYQHHGLTADKMMEAANELLR